MNDIVCPWHVAERFSTCLTARPNLMPHLPKYVCLYILKLFIFLDDTYIWRHAGGIILKLTYGYSSTSTRWWRSLRQLDRKGQHQFNASTVPSAFPVDFFPLLKRLPEWFAGSGFLQTARLWAKDTAAMVDVPYNFTKREMVWRRLIYPYWNTNWLSGCWKHLSILCI